MPKTPNPSGSIPSSSRGSKGPPISDPYLVPSLAIAGNNPKPAQPGSKGPKSNRSRKCGAPAAPHCSSSGSVPQTQLPTHPPRYPFHILESSSSSQGESNAYTGLSRTSNPQPQIYPPPGFDASRNYQNGIYSSQTSPVHFAIPDAAASVSFFTPAVSIPIPFVEFIRIFYLSTFEEQGRLVFDPKVQKYNPAEQIVIFEAFLSSLRRQYGLERARTQIYEPSGCTPPIGCGASVDIAGGGGPEVAALGDDDELSRDTHKGGSDILFVCDVCNKPFRNLKALNDGKRPARYICTFPGCKRGHKWPMLRKDNAKNHVETVHKISSSDVTKFLDLIIDTDAGAEGEIKSTTENPSGKQRKPDTVSCDAPDKILQAEETSLGEHRRTNTYKNSGWYESPNGVFSEFLQGHEYQNSSDQQSTLDNRSSASIKDSSTPSLCPTDSTLGRIDPCDHSAFEVLIEPWMSQIYPVSKSSETTPPIPQVSPILASSNLRQQHIQDPHPHIELTYGGHSPVRHQSHTLMVSPRPVVESRTSRWRRLGPPITGHRATSLTTATDLKPFKSDDGLNDAFDKQLQI
ncbi:hypothetical protein H072_11601 [Dactylellina haptotyla CBS 200.50]|uniref:Uncharacterized protein n=1 Tax=Dactylellina haptotyla (strain CBS 200.50) TaxID=1284197 RepID=S8BIL2_DACHA|nr:hypothetical protein H072_11601 [Dactylellina haptotyla CBS 200.50]